MIESIVNKFQSATKPVNALLAVNVEAMEKIAEKQTALFTGLMHEGLDLSRNLTQQTNLSGFFGTGKATLDSVNDRVLSITKDIYDVMTETQEKTGDVMKESFLNAKEAASRPAKSIKAVASKLTGGENKTASEAKSS